MTFGERTLSCLAVAAAMPFIFGSVAHAFLFRPDKNIKPGAVAEERLPAWAMEPEPDEPNYIPTYDEIDRPDR